MKTIRYALAVLPLTVALALSGCASDGGSEDAAAPAGESEVVASAPITLGNFLQHPTIKAIRTEVAAIEALSLTKTDNPGCDGSFSKFTQGDKIRKLFETGGEGGFSGEWTAYYRENGSLLFLFSKSVDETGESGVDNVSTEQRVYFDGNGKIIFQVIRDTTKPGGADRIPTGREVFAVSGHDNPGELFKQTGCGQR